MWQNYRIRSLSGLTILIFGVLALVLGAVGILSPETLLAIMEFETVERAQRPDFDYTLVFLTASSMASFNVGVYYVLASLTNWKPFFWWTVPFRTLTFIVFALSVALGYAPARFIAVAVWELVGALLTGAALLYERRQGQ
jgi:hypothetical protein